MASEFTQLSCSERKCWSEIVDHLSIHFVGGTFLGDVIDAQIAHLIELLDRHLDGLLEHHPDDRFGEGWCGQRTQIGPEMGVGGQQLGGIARFGESDLNQ